jgi:hypothetical protein
VELPHELSVRAVTFEQLRPHHCRWPIGEPGPAMMYCGEEMFEQSYCRCHYVRSRDT